MSQKAIFLDRDGVLVPDEFDITRPYQVELLPGVPGALSKLNASGYRLMVVTNQTVISRGLATRQDVDNIHRELQRQIKQGGAPPLDAIYVCPHHPQASVEHYREECDCRKPRSGMLRQAAEDWDLDLKRSYLIGDRMSDIAAGQRVGCTTILVTTGRHKDLAIESPEVIADDLKPDFTAGDLASAVECLESAAK